MACASACSRSSRLPGLRTRPQLRRGAVLVAPRALGSHVEAAAADSSVALRRTLELFYTEAWGNATPELLPSLCSGGVTYCDVRGAGCDVFGCGGLADMICDCCSTHPLFRIELDDVDVDPSDMSAVCEWHAVAADLLPGRGGSPPTGLVSRVCGLDQVFFAPDGRIRSIMSFRERFAEEEEAAAAAAGGEGPAFDEEGEAGWGAGAGAGPAGSA